MRAQKRRRRRKFSLSLSLLQSPVIHDRAKNSWVITQEIKVRFGQRRRRRKKKRKTLRYYCCRRLQRSSTYVYGSTDDRREKTELIQLEEKERKSIENKVKLTSRLMKREGELRRNNVKYSIDGFSRFFFAYRIR